MRKAAITSALVLVVLLVGAYATGSVARAGARSRLRAALERQQSEGLGASLADLGVRAPTGLDPARQQAAWEWMKEGGFTTPPPGAGDPSWFVRGEPKPPPKALEWYRGGQPSMEAFLVVLRSGPTHLGSVVDLLGLPGARAPGADDFRRMAGARIPNLLAIRHAHLWLRIRAFLEDDPAPALDDLERLRAALLPCTTLIEAMVAVASESMRNETYLALALRGRLPAPRLAAWAGEASGCATWIADGMRAERLGFAVPMSRDLLDGGDLGARLGDERKGFLGLDRLWDRVVLPFWRAPDDAVVVLEHYAAIERWLRDGGAPPADDPRMQCLGWPFGTMLPMTSALYPSAVGLRTQERAARALALLAPAGQEDAAWPADDASARARLGEHARLLDAGPFALALRYERTGDGASRVVADRAAPRHPSVAGMDLSEASLLPSPNDPKPTPKVPPGPPVGRAPALPAAIRTLPYGVEVRLP